MAKPASGAPSSRVRKNMDMDARKLAEARRVLGAHTETETVDRALDYVLFQADVFAALDRLAALGGLEDPFAAPAPAPAPRATVRRRVAEP